MSSGGRFYWVRNCREEFKAKGIIVVFAWVSISDVQLKDFVALCSSLGWNCLVSIADYLNMNLGVVYVPLFSRPFLVVRISKACLYKALQIIQRCSDVELSLEDSRMLVNCISGQIYDSDPIEFTKNLGARFALHRSIFRMPGPSKLVSLFAKGVTSSLDALFITRFGSQRAEYWKSLYSSVGLESPFLIICSENDDVAPFSTLCDFARNLENLGATIKVVKCDNTFHVAEKTDSPWK